MSEPIPDLAIVAIGRNEGDRLVRCLSSCKGKAALLVYVDSGSSDESPARARQAGADTVALDAALPFTAARARNEGLGHALACLPELTYVQFVDGDCELAAEWIDVAHARLGADPTLAMVCGRRRERSPEATLYNRLCDLEWDTPIGEATACGGDVMVRVSAFRSAGGYAPDLIAGEDPEFCHRVRKSGARILRLGHDMTLHDADMHAFGQWWQRSRRAGHAYAECWDRHRADGFRRRELCSILAWGLAVPLAALVGLAFLGFPGLLPLLGYLVLFERVRRGCRARGGEQARHARLYAGAIVVGKLAQAMGAIEYAWNRLRNRRSAIIEYKGA